MGYDNSLRKRKSNESKKHIVDVAKLLFEQKGYDEVSVLDITQKVGISKGAFYLHFKTKEDLLQHLANERFNKIKLESKHNNVYEELKNFILSSFDAIESYGIHVTQKWFSNSVMGSKNGNEKLDFDLKIIQEILAKKFNQEKAKILSREIVAVYYGALAIYSFKNGKINAKEITEKYLERNLMEVLK